MGRHGKTVGEHGFPASRPICGAAQEGPEHVPVTLLKAKAAELGPLLFVVVLGLGLLSVLLTARLSGQGISPRAVRGVVVQVWAAVLLVVVLLATGQTLTELYATSQAHHMLFLAGALALCAGAWLLVLRRVNRLMRSAGPAALPDAHGNSDDGHQ